MKQSDKWFSNPTQVYWTCKALIDGRTINHRTEIREVHGWRLGAIVHRLRHEFGWPILTEYWGKQTIAYYRLKPGTDLTKLRLPRSAKRLSEELAE